MWKRPLTFADWQTPAQRAIQLALWRDEDERRIALNNALGVWRGCGTVGCRRNRSCQGDPHACFARFWAALPDETKEEFRAAIRARMGRA
jgi:hypothetical protein